MLIGEDIPENGWEMDGKWVEKGWEMNGNGK
jgi:hypothetical protein